MKLQYLPLLGIILLMNACMWGVPKAQSPGISQDTVVYTYKTILQKAPDCKNQADSNCMIVKIKFPVFSSNQLLNDSVSKKLIGTFGLDNKSDTSVNAASIDFVKSYVDFKKQQPASPIYYVLNASATVVRQDSNLTTLQINGYTYQGGAHGITATHFINWDTKTNKSVLLSDILSNDFQTKLTEIADSIFRKSENLSDTASLKPNYFFKNGVFSLNNNYLITPLGIRFLYNEYEIKPYAAGQTNLLIPYAKIKSLLLPHTVISQYLK